MSYQDDLNALTASGTISIVTILDTNGGVYWTNQPNWQVDGPATLSSWEKRETALHIGGTRFAMIVSDWEGGNCVAKNLAGQGTVIIVRAPNNYYFLTWSSGDVQDLPTNIHADVARMAMKFK